MHFMHATRKDLTHVRRFYYFANKLNTNLVIDYG